MRLFCILLLTLPGLLLADAYRYKDPKTGEIVFTDKPPANQKAEEIEIKKPMISKPYKVPEKAVDGGSDDQAEDAESTEETKNAVEKTPVVYILSPENEEAIRDNTGNIKIISSLGKSSPGLKKRLIRIILDGQPVAVSGSLSITLPNLTRGAHTVTAQLISSKGQLLAVSQPHTFYVLRYSELNPFNPNVDANPTSPTPPTPPTPPGPPGPL